MVELDVPLIPELAYHCGLAAVAMVLSYYGGPVRQEDLAAMLPFNVIEEQGIRSTEDLVGIVRRLEYEEEHGERYSIQQIQDFLRAGLPVIIRAKYHEGLGTHYYVLRGFDGEGVLVNDPLSGDLAREIGATPAERLSYEQLADLWDVDIAFVNRSYPGSTDINIATYHYAIIIKR